MDILVDLIHSANAVEVEFAWVGAVGVETPVYPSAIADGTDGGMSVEAGIGEVGNHARVSIRLEGFITILTRGRCRLSRRRSNGDNGANLANAPVGETRGLGPSYPYCSVNNAGAQGKHANER